MERVEHVIRMFGPDYNMRAISIRRRVTGNPWFKRGTLIRAALEVLRETQEPLTAREVPEHMLAAKGVSGTAPKDLWRLRQASVVNHEGKGIMRVGGGKSRGLYCARGGRIFPIASRPRLENVSIGDHLSGINRKGQRIMATAVR
jgi:hypothetical protein